MSDIKVRGTAVVGIGAALKPAVQGNPALLPESLHAYVAHDIDLERWYPFDDYVALVRALAGTMSPDTAKGDVYRAIGIIGARRDLLGVHDNVPENQRPKQSGTYRGALAGVTGLASLVKRVLHLRERYYSRRYYKVRRIADRRLEVTLHEFPACAELCAVSTGYMIQAFRSSLTAGVWVERVSCRGDGDHDCRWELIFDDATDVTDLGMFPH